MKMIKKRSVKNFHAPFLFTGRDVNIKDVILKDLQNPHRKLDMI